MSALARFDALDVKSGGGRACCWGDDAEPGARTILHVEAFQRLEMPRDVPDDAEVGSVMFTSSAFLLLTPNVLPVPPRYMVSRNDRAAHGRSGGASLSMMPDNS